MKATDYEVYWEIVRQVKDNLKSAYYDQYDGADHALVENTVWETMMVIENMVAFGAFDE